MIHACTYICIIYSSAGIGVHGHMYACMIRSRCVAAGRLPPLAAQIKCSWYDDVIHVVLPAGMYVHVFLPAGMYIHDIVVLPAGMYM